MTARVRFKAPCRACRRSHVMVQGPCPECAGRGGDVPIPASERVYERCQSTQYVCDGCLAYRDHTNPFSRQEM